MKIPKAKTEKAKSCKSEADAKNAETSLNNGEIEESAENTEKSVDENKPEQPQNDEAQVQENDEDNLLKLYNELYDKHLRTLAEYDNYRKRTTKEKANMYNDGIADTVEKLLPIVDNFERAIASGKEEDAFYKGIVMILKQMKNTLKEMGIEEINTLGEAFNTNLHFAVAHVEDDKVGENEIIEVLQKGYKYKEKIIRPAMVKVAN